MDISEENFATIVRITVFKESQKFFLVYSKQYFNYSSYKKIPSRPGFEATSYWEHSTVLLKKSYLVALSHFTLVGLRYLAIYILDTLLVPRTLHIL
jgi:hypothetical protein